MAPKKVARVEKPKEIVDEQDHSQDGAEYLESDGADGLVVPRLRLVVPDLAHGTRVRAHGTRVADVAHGTRVADLARLLREETLCMGCAWPISMCLCGMDNWRVRHGLL